MESLPVAEVLLAGRSDWLDEPGVSGLAEHPLESVETEYPHYVGAVGDPEGPDRPASATPSSTAVSTGTRRSTATGRWSASYGCSTTTPTPTR